MLRVVLRPDLGGDGSEPEPCRAVACGLGWQARMSGLLVIAVFAVMAAEGVGDALVGGVGLAVDAVGVDLQQQATLCPARRATSVAGTPAFSARETPAWSASRPTIRTIPTGLDQFPNWSRP
jgi:hypothetical protein